MNRVIVVASFLLVWCAVYTLYCMAEPQRPPRGSETLGGVKIYIPHPPPPAPRLEVFDDANHLILRIDSKGHLTLGSGYTPDRAARELINSLRKHWPSLCDTE